MRNILITGGAGFIGKNLIHHLHEDSHNQIMVVDDLSTGDVDFFESYPHLECDLQEPINLEAHVIFHLAAITDPQYEDPKKQYDMNVKAFQNVADCAERCGATLVYASSASLYGSLEPPNKEDKINCLSEYSRSKRDCELLAAKLDTRHVGLRFFNVFGAHEDQKGRPASMIHHMVNQISRDLRPQLFKWGEQKRDFVYVKDVISALVLAMDAPSGVYNVGTGKATTFNELAKWINEGLNKRITSKYIENPYEQYQTHTCAHLQNARRGLMYHPQWSTKEGVEDYIRITRGSM